MVRVTMISIFFLSLANILSIAYSQSVISNRKQYRLVTPTPSVIQRPILRALEEDEGFVAPTVPDFPEDEMPVVPTLMPSASIHTSLPTTFANVPITPGPGVVKQSDGVSIGSHAEESISAVSSMMYIVFPLLLSVVGIIAMQLFRR